MSSPQHDYQSSPKLASAEALIFFGLRVDRRNILTFDLPMPLPEPDLLANPLCSPHIKMNTAESLHPNVPAPGTEKDIEWSVLRRVARRSDLARNAEVFATIAGQEVSEYVPPSNGSDRASSIDRALAASHLIGAEKCLTDTEREILLFRLLAEVSTPLRACVAAFEEVNGERLIMMICAAISRPFALVAGALDSKSTLLAAGILSLHEQDSPALGKLRLGVDPATRLSVSAHDQRTSGN